MKRVIRSGGAMKGRRVEPEDFIAISSLSDESLPKVMIEPDNNEIGMEYERVVESMFIKSFTIVIKSAFFSTRVEINGRTLPKKRTNVKIMADKKNGKMLCLRK